MEQVISHLTHPAPSPTEPSSARRAKVLHVGKFYPPHMGGIETHLEALCGELTKSFDLRVVVSATTPVPARNCGTMSPFHAFPRV